jgi:hypothetical protein
MKKSSSKILLMVLFCGAVLAGACSKSDADSDAGAKPQKYVIKLSATLDDGGNSSANGVSGSAGSAGVAGVAGTTGVAGLLGGQEIDLESGLPTKVSLEDPGSGMNVYWSPTDSIKVGYPYFYDQSDYRTSKTLKTTNNSGTSKSAKFQGELSISVDSNSPLTSDVSEIDAFYPASLTLDTIHYKYANFNLSSQSGRLLSFGIPSNDDVYSKIIMGASFSYFIDWYDKNTTKEISGNLNFKHLTAILKINVTFGSDCAFLGNLTISTSDSNNKLIVAGQTDVAGNIIGTPTRGDMNVSTGTSSIISANDKLNPIYVAVFGQTLNSEIVITAHTSDKGDLTYKTSSVSGKTLVGGKVYTINPYVQVPITPTP